MSHYLPSKSNELADRQAPSFRPILGCWFRSIYIKCRHSFLWWKLFFDLPKKKHTKNKILTILRSRFCKQKKKHDRWLQMFISRCTLEKYFMVSYIDNQQVNNLSFVCINNYDWILAFNGQVFVASKRNRNEKMNEIVRYITKFHYCFPLSVMRDQHKQFIATNISSSFFYPIPSSCLLLIRIWNSQPTEDKNIKIFG